MQNTHILVLRFMCGKTEKIKTEGFDRANEIATMLLYRGRSLQYYYLAIYNRNGDLVSIPYRAREDIVVR